MFEASRACDGTERASPKVPDATKFMGGCAFSPVPLPLACMRSCPGMHVLLPAVAAHSALLGPWHDVSKAVMSPRVTFDNNTFGNDTFGHNAFGLTPLAMTRLGITPLTITPLAMTRLGIAPLA